MKKTKLFGTIVSRGKFPKKPLREILDILELDNAFVFKIGEKEQFLITFNLDKNKIKLKLPLVKERYRSTIPLHRKRKNNVFYTINSLNLLEQKHEKRLDDLQDCIVLSNREKEVSILETKLIKIINYRRKEYEKN